LNIVANRSSSDYFHFLLGNAETASLSLCGGRTPDCNPSATLAAIGALDTTHQKL
jgi:hypothetical protein